MKEEVKKRIEEAEVLSEKLLGAHDAGFNREDGTVDLDSAKEMVSEGSRVIDGVIADLKESDVELEKVRVELETVKPKAEAAAEYVKEAQGETRRLLNIVSVQKKDEASKVRLADFNKKVEEGTIELREVLELGKAARTEYYDMFPPAVVSRAFDPEACPQCGTERAEGEDGKKVLECANCKTKFERADEAEALNKSQAAEARLDLNGFKVK